jgi:hypothetical protein
MDNGSLVRTIVAGLDRADDPELPAGGYPIGNNFMQSLTLAF